jgi:hypothetical protein
LQHSSVIHAFASRLRFQMPFQTGADRKVLGPPVSLETPAILRDFLSAATIKA